MRISINYQTEETQLVCILGNIPELGNWNELFAVPMIKTPDATWELQLETEATELQYRYLIKDGNHIIRKEWGAPHKVNRETGKTYGIKDVWQDFPQQHHLYTSAFTEAFFAHDILSQIKFYPVTFLFSVDCPYVKTGQILKVYGAHPLLGEWDVNRALAMEYAGDTTWQASLDKTQLYEHLEYRFIICDASTGKIVHSDEAGNRLLKLSHTTETVQIEHQKYHHSGIGWYGAGVSIPVFSLRSEDSYGIGEFPDLKKLIKWASITGQQVIQLLPVNDTSTSFTWRDSYPYSTISTYALHPIYLGLSGFSLKDKSLQDIIRKEADILNAQEVLDYANVVSLKQSYLKALYNENGEEILSGNEFHQFYIQNKDWLFPYACFCYFRDLHQTTDFSYWGEYATYDASELELLFIRDKSAEDSIRMSYFVQFLLHQQLSEVKEYAHQHNVVLKGDIPIGVNRYSVETWVEPHLFHLDMQTGAPPDAFAVFGQNWGFPTYHWEEMAKDDYQWWRRRFAKMSDYFDAYRIDHILGFFRIWEIPRTSIQGLLGHFSPAYPLTTDEIKQYGIGFNPVQMTQPHIHYSFLQDIFSDYLQEVVATYLHETGDGFFILDEACNTQEKIAKIFGDQDDDKSRTIRDGLFRLCNEVLFIEDPEKEDTYHPRIIAQSTHMFEKLTDSEEEAFNQLYENFYFHRHTDYWKQEALKKLPQLLSATSMLPCGEDLGMIPASVPEVMRELQILSLEIERWPKEYRIFADLSKLPYLSVCTTSTHDMSPIRAWWREEPEKTQQYYTDVLKREGKAPEDCIPDICRQIVFNHLAASSMLVILPLQDWLSIDGKLRKPDGNSERINIPADPAHNWQYRMHLTLEELIHAQEFNDMVGKLIGAGRGRSAERNC